MTPSGTLTALLEAAARDGGSVVTYAEDGGTATLAELLVRGRRAAATLHRHGAEPGKPVGILAKNGPDFLTAFIGALYAGTPAVPLPLPFTAGLDSYVEHIQRIAADAGLAHLVVDETLHRLGGRLDAALPGTRLIGTGSLISERAGHAETVRGADDLALVQYTSGSTANPKGVALTHRNVVACLRAIREAAAVTAADRWSLWLPLFHDMGLVTLLTALSTGGSLLLYQPRTFIRDPGAWLSRFAADRCTMSVAPNFAFDLLNAARGAFDGAPPDLSAWRLVFNGAEPVRWETVTAFQRNYAEFGLRPEVMFPVYGMAEATVAVAFPPVGAPPRFFWADRTRLSTESVAVAAPAGDAAARAVADVGCAVPGVELRVVAAGSLAADGAVGEIEIRGEPVTGGYYRRARGPEWSADGWLRTGDLGFLLDGHLHIVGRCKNVMTLRGQNYFAEDVETVARTAPGVYRGRCAALAADDGAGEYLMLLVETELAGDELDRLGDDLRRRVQGSLGLAETRISFVRPLSIPHTSSGKVRRGVVGSAPVAQPANT